MVVELVEERAVARSGGNGGSGYNTSCYKILNYLH
jgi:hypothetical protein